jgi:hypothetical protein
VIVEVVVVELVGGVERVVDGVVRRVVVGVVGGGVGRVVAAAGVGRVVAVVGTVGGGGRGATTHGASITAGR